MLNKIRRYLNDQALIKKLNLEESYKIEFFCDGV